MKKAPCIAYLRPLMLRLSISAISFVCLLGVSRIAAAQNAGNVDPTQTTDWAPGAIGHAQQMRRFKDADQGLNRHRPSFQNLGSTMIRAAVSVPSSPAVLRLRQIMRSSKI